VDACADCDDGDPAVHPGAVEVCDGFDNDCDGHVDGDDPDIGDADADGSPACEDCDDLDPAVYPGAPEECDGVDNDCDGDVDEDEDLLGLDADCPAEDCAEILAAQPLALDGAYWLEAMDGGTYQAYCDMTTNGGGWTLAAKFTNQDSRHWANAESGWTDTSPYGTTTDLSTGADARAEAWAEVIASDLMFTDDSYPGDYVATNDGCIGGLVMSDYFSLSLASFPYGGDSYYDSCDVDWTYSPDWACDPGYASPCDSTDYSLPHDRIFIARTDGGADTSGVISFYDSSRSEADVGLGALENGTQYTNDGYSQDIGGPTTCGYNDAQCASQYPETVFLWVR